VIDGRPSKIYPAFALAMSDKLLTTNILLKFKKNLQKEKFDYRYLSYNLLKTSNGTFKLNENSAVLLDRNIFSKNVLFC